ncbi:MAG: polyprenyl synthetase family protein [Desulfobacterales bacterium]|nr:polyprenyl synthetase family protein [Desulfobacterales bacterium]
MTDLKKALMARVQPDLEAIEAALHDNLTPHLELVREVAGHILFSGGKRLRPLLMVLSARVCGYGGNFDRTFSVIFEYLHAATLLHDDLVDGARLRRGKPVAHTVWDNSTAVLTGDFLLARALSIAVRTQHHGIIEIIAGITEEMSQGEIHQLSRIGDLGLSEADYFQIIRCKTAVLFQGACRVSALLADAPKAEETALADYGYHLGIAFQIADDLLDYTAQTQALGKTVGADLREGKLTLPVIHALAAADEPDRQCLEAIIKNTDFSESEFQTLVGLLDKYQSLKYSTEMAAGHVAQAKAALGFFDVSPARETLEMIADYALERKA